MLTISLALIPQPICSIAIALAIVSIDFGVVGYMSWYVTCTCHCTFIPHYRWGVHIDCVSMITIAMSIGFSVDFAAHITYGYTKPRGAKGERRVVDCREKKVEHLLQTRSRSARAACTEEARPAIDTGGVVDSARRVRSF